MTADPVHTPVLLAEVRDALAPRPGARILDGTVGAGGHAAAIAPLLAPGGLYVGVDRDPEILALAAARLAPLGPLVRLVRGTFDDLEALAREHAPGPAGEAADPSTPLRTGFDGVLLDLGVSSLQLDRPERGFSFAAAGPLDMRMDPDQPGSAEHVVNRAPEEDLANLIYEFGEERLSRRIARAIVEARRRAPIRTTAELADIVGRAVPRNYERGRIHPATRTFQALRIAVNDELGMLERALAALPSALAPGGRAAVIAFHSLEDRAVKLAFRAAAKSGTLEVLTRKPIAAGEAELAANRRARSAKLRVARRPEGSARVR